VLRVKRKVEGEIVKRVVVLILMCVAFPPLPPAAALSTTQEVEEALTCQCSCGLTVHSCNHLQCSFAVPRKQEIAASIAEGKGKEEILTAYMTQFGEKVLSAPTTTGFNLAAWLTPFLALILGGVVVSLISLRWSRQRALREPKSPLVTEVTDEYRERLKKELERFEQ
jgi:cytochrome c-type biogenesis protein CcmH